MNKVVELWKEMVIQNEKLIPVQTFEKWHQLTQKAIRTGRFRENQLEMMPGFKPVIQIIRAKQTNEDLDPFLIHRSMSAFAELDTSVLVKLSNEILQAPSEIHVPIANKEKDSKNAQKLRLRQACNESVLLLQKIHFLIQKLIPTSEHKVIAFRLGLHGLSLRRPPASSKANEVKLFLLQEQISELIREEWEASKKNVLARGKRSDLYLEELRKHASLIIAAEDEGWIGQHETDGQILPIILAKFIFESLDREALDCDKELGFWCANTALGFKLRVPESEYPLLCEAVRRQRGELALKLLVKFKDEKSALGTILDKLLDKSILSGVKSTSIFSERRNVSPIPPVQEFSNITIRQIRSQSSADESSVYLNTGRRKSRTSSMGCNRIQRKRNAACSYNINSSASEEAMLSDDNHDVRNFNLNRPNSPLSSEELRDDSSDSTDSQERLQAQVLQPPPGILANNQAAQANVSGNQQVSNTGNNRRRRTGKGNTVIPDVPNAPSDSLAHFYSGLAKKISEHAGTRDGITRNEAGYFQHDGNPNAPPYSRNLHLASFEVNLYALAIHNSITPTWLSRNYSRHGKSVTSQATEIGPTAIDVLVTSWEGHLTCSETIKLAHMVSKQSDLHNEMQKSAAELALSCLDHCSLLNPNDIRNALVQCREYSLSEFKQALITVETNAIDRDGLIPEALFEVSKQWEWLHEYQTNSTMHRNRLYSSLPLVIPV